MAHERKILKNGHAENGDQRAQRLECGRTFVLPPQEVRSGQKFKDRVGAAYQDRMSIRGIMRTFGVCYKTLIRRKAERLEPPPTGRHGGHAQTPP